MQRAISKNKFLAVLSGGGVAVFFLLPLFYSVPAWAKSVSVLFAVYVIYLTLRLVWIMAEPADASVSLKPRAAAANQKGVCCICGRNRPANQTLKVGYRKPTQIALHLGGIDPLMLGEGLVDDINLSVPICERCARRYAILSALEFLAPLGLDRSFRVLKRKPGYLRGLQHPFERSNINRAD